MFSAYGITSQPQSSTVPPTEAQPQQFAAYRQDVVHSTGSPLHSYHPHPAAAAAAAGAGSNVNMPVVQTFNNVALPAQNLL